MGTDNIIFLEVIEWFDETGRELVHRIPEGGSVQGSIHPWTDPGRARQKDVQIAGQWNRSIGNH